MISISSFSITFCRKWLVYGIILAYNQYLRIKNILEKVYVFVQGI